jgi:hypothetical protein
LTRTHLEPDPKRVLILQCDTRQLKDIPRPELRALVEAYAQRHGYVYLLDIIGNDRPCYWMKVWAILQAMKSGQFLYILYLDCDALVHNPKIKLHELFPPGKEIVLSSDPKNAPSHFNAGVMAIHVTELSLKVVQEWWDLWGTLGEPYWIKKKDGSWKPKTGVKWAGLGYEQWAFAETFVNPAGERHGEIKDILHRVSSAVLQGDDNEMRDDSQEAFTRHFMYKRKDEGTILRDYLERHKERHQQG